MNITNEDVTNYINGFYKPQAAHLAALRQEAESAGVPVILRETENFLAFLLKAFKPARILEIGTAVGYSAIFFAQLGAEVVTVEKSPDMADTARENIKEAGFESTADISGWIADWRRNYGRKCRGIYEGRCKPCNCNIVCI